ncbi:RNA polymerase sigma factor [Streptococcus dysgalactiae subsp. equisimilis]|uniref:RNA polymerase sigma factor n=1 Tax=Streptococcus dysgalactiae subsp. equisimilis TaxID=119602 RepID=A0A9X8T2P9_STREQ|nr:RNA polymerase sigma factor [Streptococcus dysgalactiae]SUN62715.1 RNA polymerase sigma factor [Streptococcus dysgalactiae subsp. equisimilis]
MRIHKTNQKDRGVYKYTTTELTKDGEYVEKTVIIKPGEDGVTELDIKMLHSLDDSEVYYNLKNARSERTKEEKAKIEKWKQKFVSDFKKRHGYEPNKYIIEDEVKDAFPRNYNLSLDFDADGTIEPDKMIIASIADKESDEKFEWSERMEEVLSLLTEKQRLVINLMYVEGYKQSEIADLMNISSAAVKKHLDKAKKIIKNNF